MPKAAQVNDPSDPGLLGGRREIGRSLSVVALKIPGRSHRVDQIVRGIDTLEGQRQRFRVKNVTFDQLRGAGDPWAEVFRSSGQATQANTSLLKQRQQTTADIARRASE